jgi:hypothetical protein
MLKAQQQKSRTAKHTDTSRTLSACSAVLLFCCFAFPAALRADPAMDPKYAGAVLTDKAPYEWRDGAKLHFFKGKYLLLGGWTVGPRKSWDGNATTNEIWSSPDLINWTLARKHVYMGTQVDIDRATEGPDPIWTPRHAFGSFVFNDYLWVIGRDHMISAPIIDVWRSKDALNWELVMKEGVLGRKRMPLVTVYKDAIHVLGGETEEPGKMGGSTATHFRSTDGINWEELPDMPFVRSSGGAVEFNGLLLVLGGNSGNTTNGGTRIRNNDVWAWDGKAWTRQTEHAPWPPMMWIDVTTYDGKVWVLAGRKSDEPGAPGDQSGAWWSADAGKTWTHVDAPWPATHADGVTATNADGIVMAGGNQIASSTYRLKRERK